MRLVAKRKSWVVASSQIWMRVFEKQFRAEELWYNVAKGELKPWVIHWLDWYANTNVSIEKDWFEWFFTTFMQINMVFM